MMETSKISIFLVLLFNAAWCDDCGIALDSFFNNGVDKCDIYEPWTYNEASEGSDGDVIKSLTPSSSSSCITSHILHIVDGYVIEINVYAKSIAKQDYVTVILYEAAENKVVGKANLSQEENNIENDRTVLKIAIDGLGDFYGFIMLMGAVSTGSVLFVESIRLTTTVEKPEEEYIVKLTSNNRAPDVYVLHTESVLKQLVHPNVAENRAMRFIDFDNFWTPLTITLAVVIPVIILILLSWGCYALGKRNGVKQEPDIIYEDVDNIPKPYLVPRVKSAYTESVAGSAYGDRNNIYSV